jgi:hypothetical protein
MINHYLKYIYITNFADYNEIKTRTHNKMRMHEEHQSQIIDVTKQNFEKILSTLKTEMPKCQFMSVDCEFTGLEIE